MLREQFTGASYPGWAIVSREIIRRAIVQGIIVLEPFESLEAQYRSTQNVSVLNFVVMAASG